ncbi:MAG TPA: hypothetical protein VHM19_23155 [Polyangiales bacterium]|jgi:hypothetical protein|nr:hypothetical protein [Polyangiales bacterium]
MSARWRVRDALIVVGPALVVLTIATLAAGAAATSALMRKAVRR